VPNLLQKETPFVWFADCQAAFDVVKLAFTTALARLLQKGRPIAFLCRQLSAAERNYGVDEQEFLVVVHAMRTWRCY